MDERQTGDCIDLQIQNIVLLGVIPPCVAISMHASFVSDDCLEEIQAYASRDCSECIPEGHTTFAVGDTMQVQVGEMQACEQIIHCSRLRGTFTMPWIKPLTGGPNAMTLVNALRPLRKNLLLGLEDLSLRRATPIMPKAISIFTTVIQQVLSDGVDDCVKVWHATDSPLGSIARKLEIWRNDNALDDNTILCLPLCHSGGSWYLVVVTAKDVYQVLPSSANLPPSEIELLLGLFGPRAFHVVLHPVGFPEQETAVFVAALISNILRLNRDHHQQTNDNLSMENTFALTQPLLASLCSTLRPSEEFCDRFRLDMLFWILTSAPNKSPQYVYVLDDSEKIAADALSTIDARMTPVKPRINYTLPLARSSLLPNVSSANVPHSIDSGKRKMESYLVENHGIAMCIEKQGGQMERGAAENGGERTKKARFETNELGDDVGDSAASNYCICIVCGSPVRLAKKKLLIDWHMSAQEQNLPIRVRGILERHEAEHHPDERLWILLNHQHLDKVPGKKGTRSGLASITIPVFRDLLLEKAGRELFCKKNKRPELDLSNWSCVVNMVSAGLGAALSSVSREGTMKLRRTQSKPAKNLLGLLPEALEEAKKESKDPAKEKDLPKQLFKDDVRQYLETLLRRVANEAKIGPLWGQATELRRLNAVRLFFLEPERHLNCPVLFDTFEAPRFCKVKPGPTCSRLTKEDGNREVGGAIV